MRKLLVWVVLMGFAFAFTSCKDDDPKPTDALVGTWALAKYTLTELPPTYSKYEGLDTDYLIGWELGYTLLFNADGTYSRAWTVDERYQGAQSIYDKGKYTHEAAKLTLSPTSTTDQALIEKFGGTPGTDFTISGDVVSQLKMTATVTVFLLPDSFTGDSPTADDYFPVDVEVVFTFNKL